MLRNNLNIWAVQDGIYVLVTVEPEGFVAKPNVGEREFILFNIGTVEIC